MHRNLPVVILGLLLTGMLSSPAAAIIGGKLYVGGGSRGNGSVQAEMFVTNAP